MIEIQINSIDNKVNFYNKNNKYKKMINILFPIKSLTKCKAIKDYYSNNPAHLAFKQNELIVIEAKYDDNIWVIFFT